ncbi:acyl-CoA dehydrogenase family protein [Plantactinospora sp. KBS50]|uniref:acyl-CoA dehydrogenase family protein n=1 Tax=Plantactinospora sp. KBS50 TaxID=2024580 RepID=UPI000BAA9EC5|nr:acyl-CoA dehydrogenase family protein [Plantactinospora sp. KBS50]ASW54766.1 acyl-CoA dehydrogenase [Plantactinospora sp. KBS50]
MAEPWGAAVDLMTRLVGDSAGEWDRAGRVPVEIVTQLAAGGVLCAQLPAEFGGLGLTSGENGELTAHAGRLCSSLRSLMTSHGMAAWTVQRFGRPEQQRALLSELTCGVLACVAFSEAGAGSDLSAMSARITPAGDTVVVNAEKVWITGAMYAGKILTFARYGDGFAAVMVPRTAPGVTVTRVSEPLGCRAAGHADVRLDGVRLPADAVLGGAGLPMDWLVTTALTYGRISVAWGCVGILRACLAATVAHCGEREQFGRPLHRHQLVAGHLADLVLAEHAAMLACREASRCWDERSSDLAMAAVLAKQVAATGATDGARLAVQVLGARGAQDGHPVARAYRDAKLMEIIEGSSEISRLLLAERALAVWS